MSNITAEQIKNEKRAQILTAPRKGLTMPTIVLSSAADTYVQQLQPSMNLPRRGRLVVGTERQTQNAFRSLLKFELSQLPASCEIIGATLKLFMESATLLSCVSIEAYEIAPDYDASNVTWDTAAKTAKPFAAFIVSYCQARQFIEVDVTELVRSRRTDSSRPQIGILLAEAGGDAGSAVFASGSDRDARFHPSLIIRYSCGSSDTASQADTDPQAEREAGDTIAYGGLYHTARHRIFLPPNGLRTVALGETMPHRNVTPGVHALTVGLAGDYSVRFMVLPHTADDVSLHAGVLINGRMSAPALCVFREYAADCPVMAADAIVTLAAGDVLSLGLSSPTGGSAAFGPGLHASLSVIRLN